MTIDEAITHCIEVAYQNEILMKRYDDASGYNRSHNEKIRTDGAKGCENLISLYRQLAEWLRELKAYREILTKLDVAIDCYENCESCQGFREYSTSQFIKDVIQINKEVNADESINSL